MKEVQYVVQIKTSVIRQVEFIDMPNLSAAEIEEYAKGLAHMEVGDFDESEILLVETHQTMQDDDVEKDEPLTLTDLPRPWSEDSMKKCACFEPQISTLVIPGFCLVCKLPRR